MVTMSQYNICINYEPFKSEINLISSLSNSELYNRAPFQTKTEKEEVELINKSCQYKIKYLFLRDCLFMILTNYHFLEVKHFENILNK